MPIRNPTAHPGVILASKQHLDSFGRYIDLAGNLVEAEKKRRAEKAAGMAEAMQTPEVDYEGILPQWQQNLMNDVGQYEKFAVDLASQGVDLTNPLSEGRLALSQMETKLKRDAAMFRQNTTIAQNTAKALAEDPDGDLYDKTASTANYALFLQNPAVLDELGGTLLVPRTKSIDEYEKEVMKGQTMSDLEIKKSDQSIPNYDILETKRGFQTEQYGAWASDLIKTKPGYKKQQQDLFSALSPEAQTVYREKATEKYGDKINDDVILTEFAADGMKKRSDVTELDANKKTSTTTGGPGPKGNEDSFSALFYKVDSFLTGNDDYAITMPLTGDSSTAKSFRAALGNIDGIDLDAGVQVVDLGGLETGSTFEQPVLEDGQLTFKKVPEIVEASYAITVNGERRIYVSTNKTKFLGNAKKNEMGYLRAPGVYDYGYRVSPTALYTRLSQTSGEYNSNTDLNKLKKAGLLGEGGEIKWGAGAQAIEVDYSSEAYK